MKFGLQTMRVICITVVMSLFSLPLFSDHASASITQNNNHASMEGGGHSNVGVSNLSDFVVHNTLNDENFDDAEKNKSDHAPSCNMGLCFSFLIADFSSVDVQSVSDEHLAVANLLLFADGMFELHRPPNA